MTLAKQLAAARAECSGAMAIAAVAVSMLTEDQIEKLRDQLVCLQLEEGL